MSYKKLLQAILAAGGSSGGAPTPTLSLDFTSALPAQVTFTRTGSRTAIVGGALTTVASGVPAIESWNGVNYGLSLEPASTNQLLQSNNFATTWSQTNITATSAQPSPDGGSNGWDIAETTTSGYHELKQDIAGVSTGVVMCTSAFIKAKSGATTNGMAVLNCNQFANTGARTVGMVDASAAAMAWDSNAIGGGAASFNSVSGGSQKLANGWTRVWSVGTTTATGTKSVRLRSMKYSAAAPGENYAGTATDGYEVAFVQTEIGVSRPTSYKATTTATAGSGVETATITDISWLNAAQGTFVIEHDVTSGVLLGSGANTVMSGQALATGGVTAKTAFAWSGTTSDLVNNGGSTTTGANPTFGADIRLLATSGGGNIGHIKTLTYYPSRLSVAQMQALTAPPSTAAAAGTYRVATQRNLGHNTTLAVSGTQPYQAFRWPATIGSGARSKLRVSTGNWFLNDAGGDNPTGNSITIESACLVRLSTNEIAPLFWGGSRSVTLTSGQVKLNSDDLLPSAFPSLAAGGVFPNLEQFEVRGKVKCSAGGSFPVGRWGVEPNAQVIHYDAAVTTVSAVDATGAFTSTGTTPTASTKGFSFVVEGPFVSGDPATLLGYGDSIEEGVGTLTTTGTWFQNAATNLGMAYLQFALGGQSQIMFWKSTNVNQYSGLGSILADNTGTNSQGLPLYYPLIYYNAKQSGVRAILRPSLNVRSTSTDNWTTNANQTATLPYIDTNSQAVASLAATGLITSYYKMNAVRDTGDKWLTDGVTANKYTVDGTHQSSAGNDLMTTEFQTNLSALIAALV